jgi:alpha-ketoglutarate-dependent taurine dioxygenase
MRDRGPRLIALHRRFLDHTQIQTMHAALPPVEHPVVDANSQSSRKTLYVNEPFTMHIVEWTAGKRPPC